jgi:hypothetical protein
MTKSHSYSHILPSGNLTAIENGPFTVDLPVKDCDFP